MLMHTWLVALSLLLQSGQSSAAPPPVPAPATQAAAKLSPVDVHVTDRTGRLLAAAHVIAEGAVSRDGMTDQSGAIVFQNMAAGTYRFRIERDGFFTLEKETTVRAGTASTVLVALTPAPPPPPPPPAPAPIVAAPPPLVAGEPHVVSIPDLADRLEPLGKDPLHETALGCSGATAARLIQARDAIAAHTHADADETLYLVAGEATLTLAGKTYALTAGSFAVVPRGAEHTVARKGKNPMILLSTLSGPACGK